MQKFILHTLISCYLILYLNHVGFGQENKDYYQIDITKDQYKPYTGHIKMGTNTSPSGEILSYTNVYLTKNGKPWFPVMGEMNVEKTPRANWEDDILKLKAAGVQIISTYVVWINHEEIKGVFDWSGNNDYASFLALCKKHNMKVWLRIGPWAHFEMRNGGFPDWLLQEKLKLRTNDEQYLSYVDRFFKEINKQVSAYYYKNGGPIIGVQLENELEAKSSDSNYDYMIRLKELALKNNIDVPYYSIFAAIRSNQNEFFRTIGGYGDSPWAQHTDKIYKSVYYFSPLENDADIGSDLFGKLDTKLYSSLPAISAEIGTGLHKTYHRRNVFSAKDKLGSGFTRTGSGLTGLGYFMFHGGVVADGKLSTFQESRITGYPNDVLLKNYDFQAPVGAMGTIDASFNELKLLNQFVGDFGTDLAIRPAFFPIKKVQQPTVTGVVKVAVRSYNNSGFIFLSNYQRLVDLPDVDNFQVELQYKGSVLRVPSKPTRFKKDEMTIWPFNMDMQGSRLIYATARPIYKLNTSKGLYYVFSSEGSCEFIYDRSTLAAEPSVNATIKTTTDKDKFIMNFPEVGKPVHFSVITKEGNKYGVLILNKKDALNSWKISQNGDENLYISDALILEKNDSLVFQKAGNPLLSFSVFPIKNFNQPSYWNLKSSATEGLFKKYVYQTPEIKLQATFKKEPFIKPDFWIEDSTFLKDVKSVFKYPLSGAAKIWTNQNTDTAYFRFNFSIDKEKCKNVILAYSGDDNVELWCNGKLLNIFSKNNYATVVSLNNYLTKEQNLIAARVVNHNNQAGLTAKLYIGSDKKIDTLITGTNWVVSTKYYDGWNTNSFIPKQWQSAASVKPLNATILWDAEQPGPLYDMTYQAAPGQSIYQVSLPQATLKAPVKDLYYTFHYQGDLIAFYNANNKLVYDDFADGALPTTLSKNYLDNNNGSTLRLQIFPVKPFYKIYLEDNFRANFYQGFKPKLNDVKTYPLYELQLKEK